ncbi:MAG: hypothetical protein LBR79_03695 [Oscillospiraceae bacterium]|nr:hypothetical protein [Oscillospiraceae bacterium]
MIISFPLPMGGGKEGISTMAVSFEKCLIFITFPQPSAGGEGTRIKLLLGLF